MKKLSVAKSIKDIFRHIPHFSSSYRHFRDTRDLYKKPKLSKMGFYYLGSEDVFGGGFEVEETEIFCRTIVRADRFINIGANKGYYCLIALSKGIPVVAFEPKAENVSFLLKNIEINAWDRKSEVFPIALSSECGIARIYGGGTGASVVRGWAGTPDEYSELVATSSLDRVMGAGIRDEKLLIVVDVEGSELSVLRGGLQLLKRDPKPVWIVEINIDAHQPDGIDINPNLQETFDLFWSNGYKSWTATTPPRQVTEACIKEVVAEGKSTIDAYNFVFSDESWCAIAE